MTDANKAALDAWNRILNLGDFCLMKYAPNDSWKAGFKKDGDIVLSALTSPAANTGDRFNEGRTEMCQHCQGSGENRNPLNDPGPCQECDGHGYFKPALQRPEPSEVMAAYVEKITSGVNAAIEAYLLKTGADPHNHALQIQHDGDKIIYTVVPNTALAPRQVDVSHGENPKIDCEVIERVSENFANSEIKFYDKTHCELCGSPIVGAPDNKKMIEALQSAKACFEIILDSANANADLTDEGIANLFNTTIQTINTALGDKND